MALLLFVALPSVTGMRPEAEDADEKDSFIEESTHAATSLLDDAIQANWHQIDLPSSFYQKTEVQETEVSEDSSHRKHKKNHQAHDKEEEEVAPVHHLPKHNEEKHKHREEMNQAAGAKHQKDEHHQPPPKMAVAKDKHHEPPSKLESGTILQQALYWLPVFIVAFAVIGLAALCLYVRTWLNAQAPDALTTALEKEKSEAFAVLGSCTNLDDKEKLPTFRGT